MRKPYRQGVKDLDKETQYKELRNPHCKKCELHATAQHVCLIGRGDLDAKVFLVGEAPGMREDDIGKPFSGRSGSLLESILEELGQSRESVYISNAVHCRPPENRTPSAREIKQCSVYLERELRMVRPKVIVPMGNTPLKAILGKSGITKLRGNTFEYENGFKATVLPTFHPAAILRNPGNLDFLVEDLQKAFDLSENRVELATIKWKVFDSVKQVEKLIRIIEKKKFVSFDTETNTTKWWWENCRVAGFSLAVSEGRGYFIPLDHDETPFTKKEQRKIVKMMNDRVFNNPEIVKLAQNTKFDMHMMHRLGCNFSGKLHDLMYVHYLLNENDSHSLDNMTLQHTDYGEYWKEVNEYGLKQGKACSIPLPILGKYGAYDAAVCLEVFNKLYAQLKKFIKIHRVYKYIHIPAMQCMFDAELRGMQLDIEYLEDLDQIFQDEIDRIDIKLYNYPEARAVEKFLKERKGKKFGGLNLNSTQQQAIILFGLYNYKLGGKDISEKLDIGFGLKPVKSTDKGNPSLDEEAVIELLGGAKKKRVKDYLSTLIELKKTKKLYDSFVKGMYQHLDKNARVHPSFRVTGTKTGRMSCREPNLQQIPRPEPAEYDVELKREIKKLFIPRPGNVFLHVDLSQAELRIMTHYSGEQTMLEWFNTGKDVHEYVANEMLGMDIEEFRKLPKDEFKAHRKRAKAVNFGTIYEIGPGKLAISMSSPKEGIIYTPRQAKAFLNDYFNLFPAIKIFIEDQHRQAEEVGYVETLFGQRRRLPDVNSEVDGIRAEALRQATNSPIQGTAGQYLTFGMNLLFGKIDGKRRVPEDCYLVNQIHDAILMEIPGYKAEETGRYIRKFLSKLPTKEYFGFEMKVPMAADAEIGLEHWARFDKKVS